MLTCIHHSLFIISSDQGLSEAFPYFDRSLRFSNSAFGTFQKSSLEQAILPVPSFRADSLPSGAFIAAFTFSMSHTFLRIHITQTHSPSRIVPTEYLNPPSPSPSPQLSSSSLLTTQRHTYTDTNSPIYP